ncbi:hypothetical protein AVEN_207-1, partial [Araneus ventricosus]
MECITIIYVRNSNLAVQLELRLVPHCSYNDQNSIIQQETPVSTPGSLSSALSTTNCEEKKGEGGPQIAILVCSRLALEICKPTANLSQQECKRETSL